MSPGRILPLLCFILLAPALESQNSSTTPSAPPPAAQTPAAPVTTMSVDVKVVTLPVTVRDKKGKIVLNLTKDDFDLAEDGKPQSIRYFSQETNLPLTVGLLVDTSMSERDNMDKERSASRSFLDQMITKPVDRAFVIHFDREVELLQDLTSDHAKLEKAVGLIDTQQAVENTQTSDQGSGQPRTRRGGGTLLYDAIFLACDEIAKKQTGRKAIVVLTDGEDRGSQETLNSAIESAQKAETVVYTIYTVGTKITTIMDTILAWEGTGVWRWLSRRRLPRRRLSGRRISGRRLSRGSRYPRQQENRQTARRSFRRSPSKPGGGSFRPSKKDSVDDIYAQIAEELRTQFILGYTPPKDQTAATILFT